MAASIPAQAVLDILQGVSRELRELDLGRRVDRVALSELSPLRFATEYVGRNKPVVITGAIDGWPAMRRWGERYLRAHPAGQVEVTVDVTPNGRGDSVTAVADPATGAVQHWFVTTHERRMTLRRFFDLMRHQNSNLSEELGPLLEDIRPGLPWAEAVFGGPPEAGGGGRGELDLGRRVDRVALSELSPLRFATEYVGRNKPVVITDHYENLYAVIRGTKRFSLLPPCDAYRMYLTRHPAASYMPYSEAAGCGRPYGEVSPRPGGAPDRLARAAAAVATPTDATHSTGSAGAAASEEGAAARGCCSGASGVSGQRLVAVLQVRWSSVDTTGGGGDSTGSGCDGGNGCDGGSGPGSGRAGSEAQGAGEEQEGQEGAGAEEDEGAGAESAWDSAGGAPLVVEVGPGELLYLPSLWYHQVEQRPGGQAEEGEGKAEEGEGKGEGAADAGAGESSTLAGSRAAASGTAGNGTASCGGDGGLCDEGDRPHHVIAVNFWYDMRYDSRYTAFQLVERLAVAAGVAERPPGREAAGW
ncbi:JmjC domain-containing protein E [Tetrabaena socialis]|uniref:JmjC domain-containing protein E n=1 Tax=Tetrabaena socialis TaxID=47790 RepID=A0A2J8AHG0_9CHLO|nr:JmjC domain-containing protein E [Tetrabaena socialis]|eukprot:PNH11941.1 JmjC domain-containing protein E [Tetrabaena socialis]